MKKLLLLLSSLFVLTAYGESLDRIVVTVNDAPIMQSELNESIASAKMQMSANHVPLPKADVLNKQVLEQMINRKLQLDAAEQAGIKATDADVEKAIQHIASSNHISVKELLNKISEEGMKVAEYKKQLLEEITIQQAAQMEIGSHIVITPEEVNEFMHSPAWVNYHNKEYHLEDILVTLPENPSPEDVATARKQAGTILNKLHHGAEFEIAAVEDSATAGSLQGGDLGWRQLAQIPPAFSDQLIHLKVNEIMGPIATPNGFHLIKLSGIRSIKQTKNAVDEHQEVQQLLYQRKMEEGMQSWVTRLRSAAFINTHPES